MNATPRYLRFARSLAFVAAPLVTACGGGQTPPTSPGPAASASAASSATQVTTDEPPQSMPTDGPCRCSWDTNAQAAPRVCKKGEPNYEGTACVPAERYRDVDVPIKGPLPPPELPRRHHASSSRARGLARARARDASYAPRR